MKIYPRCPRATPTKVRTNEAVLDGLVNIHTILNLPRLSSDNESGGVIAESHFETRLICYALYSSIHQFSKL